MTTFTETLRTDTPSGSDDPREADDRIREAKNAFVERLDIDHYLEASAANTYDDADTGEHRKITLRTLTAGEISALSSSKAYIYIAASDGELYYKDASDNTKKLTEDGELNVVSAELLGKLANDTYLTAVDNAGTGTVNLIKANASDVAVIPDGSETATSAAPTADADISNKKYVDDQIQAKLAQYDSGWFAVVGSTEYTKAHGLSSAPLHVTILAADSASPSEWFNLYGIDGDSAGSREIVVKTDGTNVYVRTGASYTSYPTGVNSWAYLRIVAFGGQ